jgi:hypothetical protein
MRGDEFETDNDQFKREIAENRVPCEFCVSPGQGLGDGEFCGRIRPVVPLGPRQVPGSVGHLGLRRALRHLDREGMDGGTTT